MNTKQLTLWRGIGLIAFAGFLATGLAGCGKVAEEVAEKAIESGMPEGSSAEISHDGDTFSMQTTTADGDSVGVQVGESLALPADFPEDIPVPEGVTWNLVQGGQIDGKANVTVQGTLKTPLAEVAAAMKKEAEGQGWAVEQTFQQAGQMEMVTYKKDERMLNMTITSTGDETSLLINSQ